MRLLGKVRVPPKGFNRCPALPSRAQLWSESQVAQKQLEGHIFLVQNLGNFYAD